MFNHLHSLNSVTFLWLAFPMLLATMKYCFSTYHIMVMLLTLEFMMLINMISLMFLMTSGIFTTGFYLSFFVLSVGEACIGLSILVFMARHSEESMKTSF